MSKKVVERLKSLLGDKILASSDFKGDDEVVVSKSAWVEVAKALKDDADLQMNHYVDMTAVDYPLRKDAPRFDVVLFMRSMKFNHRVRVKVRVAEHEALPTLINVWPGAGWSEREIFEMFGIGFDGHPDLRPVLLYPEFVGHPLRKDYDISHAQPLVEYRQVPGTDKLAPFGDDEGQPWARIDWKARMEGNDHQVSPSLAEQQSPKKLQA